jgi:hypothetical protein
MMTKEEKNLLLEYNGLLEKIRSEVIGIVTRMDIQTESLKPLLEQIESHERLLRGDPMDGQKTGLVEQQNRLIEQVKSIRAINWVLITTFIISAVSLWFR